MNNITESNKYQGSGTEKEKFKQTCQQESPERLEQRLNKIDQIHLIGIGGISMSAIAMLLLERGIKVSGSDLSLNDKIKQLRKQGVEVALDHRAENLGEAELVVYSSAIPPDNPELLAARRRGIRTWQRAEMLALLTREKRLVAVSGTHGKTTTTGMLASIFLGAGQDPDVMVGGDLDLIKGNYRTGQGEFFLTEADESDGSLLHFSPEIAVITNIELEHMDFYQSKEELLQTMGEFLARSGWSSKESPGENSGESSRKAARRNCSAVLCLEDELIRERLIPDLCENYPDLNLITYGFERGDLQARNIAREGYNSKFELIFQGVSQGYFQLTVPGEHNILNALAAAAAANQAGIAWKEAGPGLRNFSGVKRRFEIKGEVRGITVIDDYAHHPTEIESLFATAAELDYQRIITVFQPHRYTRTDKLWQDFVQVLSRAPGPLLLTAIYPAHQRPIPGVNSRNLLADIKERIARTAQPDSDESEGGEEKNAAGSELQKETVFPGIYQGNKAELRGSSQEKEGEEDGLKAGEAAGDRQEKFHLALSSGEAIARLIEIARPGDLVLTAGAGDVYQIGEDFLNKLQQDNI